MGKAAHHRAVKMAVGGNETGNGDFALGVNDFRSRLLLRRQLVHRINFCNAASVNPDVAAADQSIVTFRYNDHGIFNKFHSILLIDFCCCMSQNIITNRSIFESTLRFICHFCKKRQQNPQFLRFWMQKVLPPGVFCHPEHDATII